MNKKVTFGGVAVLLAGAGVALWVSKQQQASGEASGDDWTTADIPDQSGRVAIVTGANSGIGYEAALALAQKGATVVMACRSLPKAESAAEQIRQSNPPGQVVVMHLDLASLDSVRGFVADFLARYDRLDLLINNAGVMALPQRYETADGFEMQFGTNHLGHFALTGLLLDVLSGTPQSRVVTVSSGAHEMGKVEFDNLNAERDYQRWGAYGLSKLANLLFTYELQRRLERVGKEVKAVAAHPGYSDTNLQAHTAFFQVLNKIMAQDQSMGALPTLRAATDPTVHGGDYYGPGGFMAMRGYPVKVQSNDRSHDEAVAARLWQASEELTGVTFPI
ncbi:MAG: SDR family NAD(P)-dependent oxidoreductase [Anaerolineae bacterium]|nr:SDR family NAD(P)-dependent oxidoreductase [Anaerolineae bacterium]